MIDTGIRATHQEFTGRMGNGSTAINDGQGINDCNGHGTHVAGTTGGTAALPPPLGSIRAVTETTLPLDQQLEEIGAQLAWVRDYL